MQAETFEHRDEPTPSGLNAPNYMPPAFDRVTISSRPWAFPFFSTSSLSFRIDCRLYAFALRAGIVTRLHIYQSLIPRQLWRLLACVP